MVVASLAGSVLLQPAHALPGPSVHLTKPELADFVGIQTFANGAITQSPDGERLLFPACGFANEKNGAAAASAVCQLQERNLASGRVETLIELPGLEDAIFSSWSPQGSSVAFIVSGDETGDKEGGTLFVRMSANAPRAIYKANPEYPPKWINEQEILFVSQPAAALPAGHEVNRDSDVDVYTFSPGERSRNGEQPRDDLAVTYGGRLLVANVRSGQVRAISKDLNLGPSGSHYASLSPEGDRLVYANQTTDLDMENSVQAKFDVWLLDLTTGASTRMAGDVIALWGGFSASWSQDERYVAWFSDTLTKTGTLYAFDTADRRLYRSPASAGDGRDDPTPSVPWHLDAGAWNITTLWGMGRQPPLWIDDHRIVTAVYRGPADAHPVEKIPRELWLVDVRTGQARRLWGSKDEIILGVASQYGLRNALQKNGRILVHFRDRMHNEGWKFVDLANGTTLEFLKARAVTFYGHFGDELPRGSPDGSALIAARQSGTQPPDIWTFPLDGTHPTQLTELNPNLAHARLGTPKTISYTGPDHKTYRAGILLPPSYRKGCPVPLIVDVYYMNSRSTMVNFFGMFEPRVSNALLLSSRGYAVLAPDINTVSAGNRPQEITNYVMDAVDEAVRLGYADPNKLAVTGHSFGGYSTYSAIANTPRFRAAVVRSGFADWIMEYLGLREDGTNDVLAEGSRGPGGTPWSNLEGYIRNSPLFDFDKVETPTLIVHGTSDDISVFNARAAYAALRRLRKPVTMALYKGEGHVPDEWSWNHQMDYGGRVLEWYQRYLGSGSSPACPSSRH
jgi:dipeptidyl aminopeptidase/acylaminoacyl peptidase